LLRTIRTGGAATVVAFEDGIDLAEAFAAEASKARFSALFSYAAA
jgi:hypothetical protein